MIRRKGAARGLSWGSVLRDGIGSIWGLRGGQEVSTPGTPAPAPPGDPRCSSPGEGGEKGGSPDLAPPLGLLPRGRGVRASFGGSGDRGTRLCPLERLPVSPRRRAAKQRSRGGRGCCMCGCWMRRRRRRRRRGAAAAAGC